MKILDSQTALYTDYYQLTMAQGYYLTGKSETRACFDYFFRENPFAGGYVIFAGISDVFDMLERLEFDDDAIEYLRSLGMRDEFLKYLRNFRFRGTIHAPREGELVFPLEPIVRVEGTIIEAQLIETLLLNLVNFESLIATKASRLKFAAGNRRVVDFGLRRAQGLGGIHGSKAAIIGGVDATSNVYTAFHYSLDVSGTQGHSWVQCFGDELTAFRKFAEIFPERCILLVDTYNTLRSGLPHAITVAKELEKVGQRLIGIRLDSGDLAYLSKHARAMLDAAGLPYVKIVVSNQLDEYVIRSLLVQEAPIDVFGVGTRLITGQDTSALDGVYKLSMSDGEPRLKFSENNTKLTLPGVKKVLRYCEGSEMLYADGVLLEEEQTISHIFHPFFPEQQSNVGECKPVRLLVKMMEAGKVLHRASVPESARYARERLTKLAPEHKRFENPHTFKVGISESLLKLRTRLVEQFQRQMS